MIMRNVMQRWLLGVVRLVVGARGRYASTPPDARQTIYFANHSSHVDTLAILAALPPDLRASVRPAAARDYWDATPTRRFIANRVLGVVYVTRQGAAGEDPLQAVRDALAAGWSIIIFPEGTRSATGEIGPFKSGLYWLSRDFPDVQLVPVHLSDLVRAMPKGKLLPVPINCHVSFGDAVPGAASLDKDTFLATARDAVIHLQESVRG
ncbi:MAG: lysophospholipid acyltransferase family protein [Paraburkholderia tropica]|nr:MULTISPECIES: lysophospholipid acyltransferase family protein [Paraburkholderia]MDE1138666.1 lysophospholipid acyltransferase family protein [Paraburkholderia tropica]QNB14504.1 1-acyl-sn-glycerol-3-phosphate acyltransferase [Paraburkholderia tropica]RQM45698.1 1-acyl-sn-glycerol-3-phosphate acyltransferase [Paraburkholderia bannensis]RQN37923.1 1-acyl-sn-glycerol-3-phosphate acyltransferase [Paraburkholderia tropica]